MQTSTDVLTYLERRLLNLSANTELFDNRSVTSYIGLCEILQEATTLTNH